MKQLDFQEAQQRILNITHWDPPIYTTHIVFEKCIQKRTEDNSKKQNKQTPQLLPVQRTEIPAKASLWGLLQTPSPGALSSQAGSSPRKGEKFRQTQSAGYRSSLSVSCVCREKGSCKLENVPAVVKRKIRRVGAGERLTSLRIFQNDDKPPCSAIIHWQWDAVLPYDLAVCHWGFW